MFARPAFVRRRPLLRAAAVGGTFAAGRAMGRRAEQQSGAEADQNQRISNLEANQVAQQPTQPTQQAPSAPAGQSPGGSGASVLDQLNQLSALHQQGALSDEEFAAAKAQVLGR